MKISVLEKNVSIFKILLIYAFLEIIRKYFFFTPVTLVVFDLYFLSVVVRNLELNEFLKLCLVLLVCILHGIAVSLMASRSPIFVVAGLREIIFLLGGYFLARSGSLKLDNSELIGFLALGFIVSGFGVLQITSGQDSILNFSPAEFQLGVSQGHGFFVPELESVIGEVFRPNSIFPVTGKFGVFIGVISIFVLINLAWVSSYSRTHVILVLFALILINLIPFQRAVLYPLLLGILFFLFSCSKLKSLFLLFSSISLAFFFINSELGKIALDRVLIFPMEVLDRLDMLRLGSGLFEPHNLFGQGFGYYSNYASLIGGEAYSSDFGGESGWLVLTASVGMVGMSIVLLGLWWCTVSGFVSSLLGTNNRWLAFICGFTCSVVMIWAVTHNVLGSPLVLLMLGCLVGLQIRDRAQCS